MNLLNISKDYKEAFDANLIPFKIYKTPEGQLKKHPLIESYEHWQTNPQSIADIEKINWNGKTNAIGLILGVNNWGCFDFDMCKDETLLYEFITDLGLNKEYEWIVDTPNGYHVYFIYDNSIFISLGQDKAKFDFKLINTSYKCDHIELRLKKCISVLPPSELSKEIKYSFINVLIGLPSNSPDKLATGIIKEAIDKYFLTGKDQPAPILQSTYKKNNLSESVYEGHRHNHLASQIGFYKSKGLSENETLAIVLLDNEVNFKPPLPKREIGFQVHDIYKRYEPNKEIKLVSAKGLQAMIIKPINWIIDNFLCAGLIILAGRPKIGKSWLALIICFAVSTGGIALGKFKANRHSVLYIPYEDPPRRLQDRINNILSVENMDEAPANLFYPEDCNFPKLNQNGIETLEQILNKDESIKLVVIDTLGRAIERSTKRNTNLFQDEYDFGAKLQRIAVQRNISIILVHHTSKMKYEDVFDQVLGTTGLTASPDSLMMLYKDKDKFKLSVTGRDILSNDYDMKFDNCIWYVSNESEQKKLTPEREKIIELLTGINEPQKTKDIADALRISVQSASNILQKLVNEGILSNPKYGKYSLCMYKVV